VELGKLAGLNGNRSRALEEYRLAIRDCRAGGDAACVSDAKRLLALGHR
jgi:hypothetical protein